MCIVVCHSPDKCYSGKQCVSLLQWTAANLGQFHCAELVICVDREGVFVLQFSFLWEHMDGEYHLAYIHTVTINIMEHTWAMQNINIYNGNIKA